LKGGRALGHPYLPPSLGGDTEKFRKLSVAEAIDNADSYAWFWTDVSKCCLRRRWLVRQTLGAQ
jgi:hypothetical protein